MSKYSSIIYLPVLMLYPFVRRKYLYMLWVWPIAAVLALWMLHNQIMYDSIHIIFLTEERRNEHGFNRMEFIAGAFVIISSILFLLPALLWNAVARKRWVSFALGILAGIIAWFSTQMYLEWRGDFQYMFWAVLGAMTLYYCLEEGLRRGLPWLKDRLNEDAADSLFLFAALCAPVLFSLILVPFQATRHFITAVPLFVVLAFRAIEYVQIPKPGITNGILVTLVILQGLMSFLVQAADYEYANIYRTYARQAEEKYTSPDYTTWFVGHWGWKFYAERAGFRMRHSGEEEFPQPGDIIIRPVFVALHDHFREVPGYFDNYCEVLEEEVYPGNLPLRTMNFRGASFYAVTSSMLNIPYRFFHDYPLDTFMVYRVTKAVQPEDIVTENLPE
jgi:hypothetical protein